MRPKEALPRILVYLLPGLLAFLILRPEGPLGWFVLPGLLGLLWLPAPAGLLVREKGKIRPAGPQRLVSSLGLIAVLCFVAFLLIYALSIPSEVYRHWFREPAYRPGSPPSLSIWALAWAFGMLTVPLARKLSLGLSLVLSGGAWVLLMSALWSQPIAGYLSAGAFAAFLVFRVLKAMRNAGIAVSATALLALLLVFIIPDPEATDKLTPDQYILQELNSTYPDFPLILDIPGRGFRQIRDDFGPARNLSPRVIMVLEGLERGRYYLEVRRSSWLSDLGWQFLEADAKGASPLESPLNSSYDSGISIELMEPWWYPPPPLLQNAGLSYQVLGDYELPLPRGAVYSYARAPETPEEANEDLTAVTLLPSSQILKTPEEIRKWAEEDEGLGPGERVERLQQRLQEGFRYSLLSSATEPGGHPLDAFFRELKGYCLHFATAAAVYFEYIGYDPIFVEGFAGSVSGEKVNIRGLDSHAWVLVDDEDGHTHLVDVTPPIRFMPEAGYQLDELTRRYLDQLGGVNQMRVSGAFSTDNFQDEDRGNSSALWWLLSLLLLLPFLLFLLRYSHPAQRWKRRMLLKRSAPLSLEEAEARWGLEAARNYYLPSLLLWNGYESLLSYKTLRSQLEQLEKLEQSRSEGQARRTA